VTLDFCREVLTGHHDDKNHKITNISKSTISLLSWIREGAGGVPVTGFAAAPPMGRLVPEPDLRTFIGQHCRSTRRYEPLVNHKGTVRDKGYMG
jgi:hypothetical protein